MNFISSLKQSPRALVVGPITHEHQHVMIRDKVTHFLGPVILLDGALNMFDKKPQNAVAVGDGDSCRPERRAWLDIVLPTNKDQSDLAYALKQCLPANLSAVETFGLRGERWDHELFNFGEISHFLGLRSQLFVCLEDGLWAFAPGEYPLNLKANFSLLSFHQTQISLQGDVKYSLQNHRLEPVHSLGLSNSAFGEFTLKIDKPLFIYVIPPGS